MTGPGDLDDAFFAVVQLVGLALAVRFAWTWRRPPEAVRGVPGTGRIS